LRVCQIIFLSFPAMNKTSLFKNSLGWQNKFGAPGRK
jgi:hypothetical protein